MRAYLLRLQEADGTVAADVLYRNDGERGLVDPDGVSLSTTEPFVRYGREWRITDVHVTENLVRVLCVTTEMSEQDAIRVRSFVRLCSVLRHVRSLGGRRSRPAAIPSRMSQPARNGNSPCLLQAIRHRIAARSSGSEGWEAAAVHRDPGRGWRPSPDRSSVGPSGARPEETASSSRGRKCLHGKGRGSGARVLRARAGARPLLRPPRWLAHAE
jgi:hypothetical protein